MKELVIGLIGVGVGYGAAYLIAQNKGQANAVNPFAQGPLINGGGLLPPSLGPLPPIPGINPVTPVTATKRVPLIAPSTLVRAIR